MAEPKGARNRQGGSRPNEPKNVVSDLIPANPLSGRSALIQIAFLIGIPVVLLLLAGFVFRRFFPALGY
jgi:hypothetical protein